MTTQQGEAFPPAPRKINPVIPYLDNLHVRAVTPGSFPRLPPEPSTAAQFTPITQIELIPLALLPLSSLLFSLGSCNYHPGLAYFGSYK